MIRNPERLLAKRGAFAFAFVFALLVGLVGAACTSSPGAGELAVDTQGADASGGASENACAIPTTGCSCPAEGAAIPCGEVKVQSGSYLSCSMGTRTCTAGVWGACVGDHVVEKHRPTTDSLGVPTSCSSTNPCDPYCNTIIDTPGGVDAGAAFSATDAGLTLSGAGAGGTGDAGALGTLPLPSVCLPGCTNGTACVAGSCVCPAYETLCAGSCIPTTVDPNNCGGCGVKCTGSLSCSSGVCSSACATGLTACSNSCVDESNDSNNCGSCGHVCGTGTGCSNGGCVAEIGTAACTTTLTGTILDPAKLRPVYGAQVFIPTVSPAPALSTGGVACDTCANLFGSTQLLSTVTAADGTFTLAGVPSGASFTLVIQLGRWRRQVTVPAITVCGTAVLATAKAHLPARHVRTASTDEATDIADPDIPLMAVVTGHDDATECLLFNMGIATSEFTLATGTGRVHMYSYDQADGLVASGNSWNTGGVTDPGATLSGGNSPASPLFSTAANLNKYNFVLAPCADNPAGPTSTMRGNMYNWVNAGGRLFTSHHGYEDWVYGQTGWNSTVTVIGPLPFSNDTPDPSDRPTAANPLNDTINTSFAGGVAMAKFIQNTWSTSGGPGGAAPPYGTVPLPNARHDIDTTISPAVSWLSGDSTSTMNPGAGPQVNIMSFDTPVSSPAASQCGRVIAPEMHVSGNSVGTFPAECGTVPGALSGQELAFEFMMYESMACLQSVSAPPPTPTPPASCAATTLPSVLGGGCSASLAQQTFKNGICSCSALAVNSSLLVDSYNSQVAPYAAGGTSGSIATNGMIQSNAVIDDEGALYAAGTGGIVYASSTASTVKQTITSGGNVTGKVNVSGNGAIVGTASGGAVISGTTTHPTSVANPCDCSTGGQVPVAAIVAPFALANNNATIGLSSTALVSSAAGRLDLPCGNFYLTSITANGSLTIDAHGRTALYISGDVIANQQLAFTVEPGAEMDVYIAGNLTTNSTFILGSPNYPAMTRLYIGSSGTVNINATGARLAGEFYNAAGSLHLNTASTVYGSIYTGGLVANSALSLHDDTAVTTLGTSECGVNLVPQTFTRDFQAVCSVGGTSPEWEFFEWQATVPSGTSISFTAQTADTEANLGGAPAYALGNPPVSAGTASSTTTNWTSDANTVAYHLMNDVPSKPQVSQAWLRVSMTLNPNGANAPTLQQWQQLFDCKPSQ